MECETARRLVEQIVLEPGWRITAEDHTKRFQGAIKVHVDYPAQNTNREHAEKGFDEMICTYAEFVIMVGRCEDDKALYREIIAVILKIKEHEIREYFRVKPTYWAPFHPHREDGMARWGASDMDVNFGIT